MDKKLLTSSPESIRGLIDHYRSLRKPFLLRSELWDEFQAYAQRYPEQELVRSPLSDLITRTQEAALNGNSLYLAIRPRIARWHYLHVDTESLSYEEVPVEDFLRFKETLIGRQPDDDWSVLEIDLAPFNREFPRMQESRSIGRGVQFLNKRLSSQLFNELERGDKRLLDFLSVHQYQGRQLMLNQRISRVTQLRHALRNAEDYLSTSPQEAEWEQVSGHLQALGFEVGWGRTVGQIRTAMSLLGDIMEAPEPAILESFLGRWDATEMPDKLDLNGMAWSLYEFAGDGSLGAYGGHVAVSLTEEGYYLVLAVGPADQQAQILEVHVARQQDDAPHVVLPQQLKESSTLFRVRRVRIPVGHRIQDLSPADDDLEAGAAVGQRVHQPLELFLTEHLLVS